MKTKIVASVVVAVVALLGAGDAKVQAKGPPCGAFVIENPTAVPVKYWMRWGNDNWELYCVLPGRCYTHTHLLNAGGRVPQPQIKFDGVGNGEMSYDLKSFATSAPTVPGNGKPFEFRYSTNGRCLDLYPR